MKEYKVSVVIPTYNASKTIERSILSIVNQDLKDIQIIIVNDGSTDDTLNVLKKFTDNRFIVINKDNRGVSSARNVGIEVANGEYIAFLDSDDYYDLDAIKKMYELAHNNDLDIVSCGHTEKNSSQYGGNYQTFDDFIAINKKEIGKHYLDLFPKSACMKLFRSSIIKKHKIRFDEGMSLGEDLYFTWSVLSKTSRIGGVGSTFYRIKNINPESLSKKYVKGFAEDLLIQYKEWKRVSSIFPEAKEVYYCNNMDYGLSVVASFVNNLFKIGCPLKISEKMNEVKQFIKNNDFLYESSKLQDRRPKTRFDKIQYKILMTKSVTLMCLFFWFKEKIKKIKFKKGLANSSAKKHNI